MSACLVFLPPDLDGGSAQELPCASSPHFNQTAAPVTARPSPATPKGGVDIKAKPCCTALGLGGGYYLLGVLRHALRPLKKARMRPLVMNAPRAMKT